MSDALDVDDIRALLFEMRGNVTKAAEALDVDSERLRRFVYAIPRLRDAMAEIMERSVDAAVEVIHQGLADEGSFQNRFYAAKEMLRSEAGRRRGYGAPVVAVIEGRTAALARSAPEIKWLEVDVTKVTEEERKDTDHEQPANNGSEGLTSGG